MAKIKVYFCSICNGDFQRFHYQKVHQSAFLKGKTYTEIYGERGEEIKKKIGIKSLGRTHKFSEESIKKMVATRKRKNNYFHTSYTKRKMSNSHKGKWTEKQKITQEKKWQDQDFRKRMLNALSFKNHHHTDEAKKNIGLNQKGKLKHNEETKKKLSILKKGVPTNRHISHTSQTKEQIQKKLKTLWKDPSYAEEQIRKFKRKPSLFEIRLTKFLSTNFPNEWKYTGDGSIWITINGKHYNPDFMNVNGQKQIIEFQGFYTHNEEEENQRQKAFNKLGFNILFLYPTDLNNLGNLFEKIRGVSK